MSERHLQLPLPAQTFYLGLAVIALLIAVQLLLRQYVFSSVFVPILVLLFGWLGLAGRWSGGPAIVFLLVAFIQWRLPDHPLGVLDVDGGLQRGDLALAAALLLYTIAHYRYLAYRQRWLSKQPSAETPQEQPRPESGSDAGDTAPRSPASSSFGLRREPCATGLASPSASEGPPKLLVAEPIKILLMLPIPPMLAVVFWQWVQAGPGRPADLGSHMDLRPFLAILWTLGTGTILLRLGGWLLDRQRVDPQEAELLLNDVVYRELRREIDHLTRRVARGR